ncbi:MAG: DUF4399 domain-containing protein [Gemmatimonadota bacterium]
MTTDSMKKTRRFATPLTMMVGMALLACGGAEQAEPGADGMAGGAPEAEAPMTVRITEPAEGATLEGPFRVAFEVEGLTLVPAGTDQPRSGHHHLLIDHDIPPSGQPIPSTEGYIHMGQAQPETMVEGLAPGEYRLIAVVADFAHVPLEPLVVDTIHVTVR